jgi:hypothetical protein
MLLALESSPAFWRQHHVTDSAIGALSGAGVAGVAGGGSSSGSPSAFCHAWIRLRLGSPRAQIRIAHAPSGTSSGRLPTQ